MKEKGCIGMVFGVMSLIVMAFSFIFGLGNLDGLWWPTFVTSWCIGTAIVYGMYATSKFEACLSFVWVMNTLIWSFNLALSIS